MGRWDRRDGTETKGLKRRDSNDGLPSSQEPAWPESAETAALGADLPIRPSEIHALRADLRHA